MIRLTLDAPQLATARFAVSPLLQVVASLVQVRGMSGMGSSRLAARWAAMSSRSRSVLESLVDPATGYVPDFLTPWPHEDRPTLERELQAVRESSAGRVRQELARFVRLGPVADAYARARGLSTTEVDSSRRDPTTAQRDAWAGNVEAVVLPAADALAEAWTTLVAPDWPLLAALLESDIWHRVRRIALGGVHETVLDLVGTRSPGPEIEIDTTFSVDLRGRTGRVVLAPVVALDTTPPLAVMPGPEADDLYLGYPCRGRGAITAPFASRAGSRDSSSGLAEVIGATRQRLLAELAEPQSGRSLAARLGISPATVSYHLGRLDRGGLVRRHRVGREVVFTLTDSGQRLHG